MYENDSIEEVLNRYIEEATLEHEIVAQRATEGNTEYQRTYGRLEALTNLKRDLESGKASDDPETLGTIYRNKIRKVLPFDLRWTLSQTPEFLHYGPPDDLETRREENFEIVPEVIKVLTGKKRQIQRAFLERKKNQI